jgi:hypothetical protein
LLGEVLPVRVVCGSLLRGVLTVVSVRSAAVRLCRGKRVLPLVLAGALAYRRRDSRGRSSAVACVGDLSRLRVLEG